MSDTPKLYSNVPINQDGVDAMAATLKSFKGVVGSESLTQLKATDGTILKVKTQEGSDTVFIIYYSGKL